MVGFKVLSAMKDSSFDKKTISSLALAIGDLIEQEAGAVNWTKCDSTSECFTRKAIVMEVTTTTPTQVLSYELDGTETVEAACTNAASATYNGDRHTLTDENTVNNDTSDITTSVVSFYQDRIGSETKSIIGRVVVGNGVTLAA